jgi:hypothetical protein
LEHLYGLLGIFNGITRRVIDNDNDILGAFVSGA